MEERVKLKGHESFSIREGWLAKGLYEIENNSKLFSSKESTDILGIGTNMVKSLKYWLLTANLIQEEKKAEYGLTDFGKLVFRYDPYIQDIFTLYLIHLEIISNKERALVWNLFFNKCNLKRFTKRDVVEQIEYELDLLNKTYNEKLLLDEINVVMKTYAIDEKIDNPENNFTCPLTELRLLRKIDREFYQKENSTFNLLDKLIVFWCILQQIDEENSANIEDLLKNENSVCRKLNLDKASLNEYLEMLKREDIITINRTSGVNMIYINKKYCIEEIFRQYFEEEK